MNQKLTEIHDAVTQLDQRLSSAISSGIAANLNETTRSTLLSSYSDAQKSLDMIHDRMDRLSQNYKISIGAVFALFFAAGSNAPREVVFVAVGLSAAAAWQLWQMWIVSCKMNRLEALCEIELLGRTDGPASRAFQDLSSHKGATQEDSCLFGNRRHCDRVIVWSLFSIFLLIVSTAIYTGDKVYFNSKIQPRSGFLLNDPYPIKCSRVMMSIYECEKR